MAKIDHYSGYDKTNPISIEIYSQKMIGKTFREIWEEDDIRHSMILREESVSYGTTDVAVVKRNKGNLGQIIEEKFFHYKCNNDSRADFNEAGVELKVTPYRINKNGTLSAKERLILTMIDYYEVVNEPFEESHFWNKSKLILLVYYLYLKDVKDNLDYKIGYSRLFTPPEQDLKIIKHDYYVIVSKIKAGCDKNCISLFLLDIFINILESRSALNSNVNIALTPTLPRNSDIYNCSEGE